MQVVVLKSAGMEVEEVSRELGLRGGSETRESDEMQQLSAGCVAVPELPLVVGRNDILDAALSNFKRVI